MIDMIEKDVIGFVKLSAVQKGLVRPRSTSCAIVSKYYIVIIGLFSFPHPQGWRQGLEANDGPWSFHPLLL